MVSYLQIEFSDHDVCRRSYFTLLGDSNVTSALDEGNCPDAHRIGECISFVNSHSHVCSGFSPVAFGIVDERLWRLENPMKAQTAQSTLMGFARIATIAQ